MASNELATKKLTGIHAVSAKKGKRIGKVRRFVFHPSEKRLVGFLVKRPDAALMFHRKDLFVPLSGAAFQDGCLVVGEGSADAGPGAVRALGLDWDRCVLWVGMPLMTASGDLLGYVDDVAFDGTTGAVSHVTTENGAAADIVLGKRTIPAGLIRGFKAGTGMRLVDVDAYQGQEEDQGALGAILVSDEALGCNASGGVAAAAGKATAVVSDKARKGARKAKPVVRKATDRAGEAVQEGAFALGRQLGRTKGMFSAFKEEYRKAASDDADGKER